MEQLTATVRQNTDNARGRRVWRKPHQKPRKERGAWWITCESTMNDIAESSGKNHRGHHQRDYDGIAFRLISRRWYAAVETPAPAGEGARIRGLAGGSTLFIRRSAQEPPKRSKVLLIENSGISALIPALRRYAKREKQKIVNTYGDPRDRYYGRNRLSASDEQSKALSGWRRRSEMNVTGKRLAGRGIRSSSGGAAEDKGWHEQCGRSPRSASRNSL